MIPKTAIACVISLLALIAPDAGACSSLLLQTADNVVIGHNLNLPNAQPALVFVNPRGARKRSLSWEYLRAPGEIAEPVVEWRAKYGSVTFCCESVDFSTAGYNEAGLFVSDLYCKDSTWKPAPEKATLHLAQWMQYVLDQFGSIKEVVEHFEELPAYVWENDHLFFADKSGDTATLEFTNGKPRITTGREMPVKALTNCTYESAMAGQDGRFTKIKDMLSETGGSPVDRVWETLDACPSLEPKHPNIWQVVVDTRNRKLQFASIRSHARKVIDLAAVDFSETARIKCLDVYATLEGDVLGKMIDWTPEINSSYTLERSFRGEKDANIRAKLDKYCREYVVKSQIETRAMPWQTPADAWRAMRVGLFVHWGPSSGRELAPSHSHARHSALNPHGSVPAEVYDTFYQEFNPTLYDPDAMLQLAHDAGMRYAVFVAKHHDGFCMFKTAATDYNIMATPYGKDVAAMFAAACQRKNIALGWQISPKDWKHPDFNTPNHDRYNAYYEKLVDELSANYGPLSVMWFDGIEPVGPDKWKETPERVSKMLHQRNPDIMLGVHGGSKEDFLSFENMVAPFDRQRPWEMCEAINPSGWVYNKPMPPFPLRGLLRNLVHTVARDGNYLLDVGPMPDGRLYPPDAERLAEMATWMKTNAEGIHGTRGGPYRDGEWGGATCKENSIYLFISDLAGGGISLPSPAATIRSARRLDGGALEWKVDSDRLRLDMPDRAGSRPVFTCVKLELDRPAFDLPIIESQPNLAASATVTASSVRDDDPARFGPRLLFDTDGDSAWESKVEESVSTLDFDLGESKRIGSLAIAERAQRTGWNHSFTLELKVRSDASAGWRLAAKHTGKLGGPPILTFDPVNARHVRVEISKKPGVALQVAELRLFPPLGVD